MNLSRRWFLKLVTPALTLLGVKMPLALNEDDTDIPLHAPTPHYMKCPHCGERAELLKLDGVVFDCAPGKATRMRATYGCRSCWKYFAYRGAFLHVDKLSEWLEDRHKIPMIGWEEGLPWKEA